MKDQQFLTPNLTLTKEIWLLAIHLLFHLIFIIKTNNSSVERQNGKKNIYKK